MSQREGERGAAWQLPVKRHQGGVRHHGKGRTINAVRDEFSALRSEPRRASCI